MTEKNDWTNEEILYFLECYRQEPCIWNPGDRNHKDKKKIAEAWIRLGGMLNKTVKELKMKKEILMVTFRKHLKRKTESIRSGKCVSTNLVCIWTNGIVSTASLC